jgi:cyclopropane-fatty-acyl-phospholipid synthase
MIRRLVQRRLEGLHGGRVTLREGGSTMTWGEAGDLRARLTVRRPRFYRRVALGGSLGAAESFLDGDWEADDLTALLRILARNLDRTDRLDRGPARAARLLARGVHALRRNTRRGSRRNIADHYDLGNDFFALFLDETMTYSCGVFETPSSTLKEASVAKLDRVCRKLGIGPEDHVLEIGTGWGSFAIHAAGRYGCRVTTTTISKEQHELAAQRVREAGLADRITLLLSDYRDLEGKYGKLVSIEMIEAVGHRYFDTFFRRCSELLEDDGRMLLQAIVMPDHRYARYLRTVDFVQRHVFPGSCLPSVGAIAASLRRATDLRLTHREEIGPHYATTLRHWRERFSDRIEEVRRMGYPERFVRLWHYYLAYCEAGFAERYIGDVQVLLAKPGCRTEPIPAGSEAVKA